MIFSIVAAFVGVAVGRAAAVVVGGIFGHYRRLTDHVLVGQVEAQVAELCCAGAGQGWCAGAVRTHQVVGGVAVRWIRQEVFHRDAASLVVCRVVEGDALDVHLVFRGVDFNLVVVHVFR